MMLDAPASFEPAMAALPTPPQPNTATLSPRPTAPVLMAAPIPAITPHPATDTRSSGGSLRINLGALTGRYERFLRECTDAQGGRQFGAVGERHLLFGVVRVETEMRPSPVT